MAFYNQEINEIFKQLNTSNSGISKSTIDDRQKNYGKNEFEKQKKTSFFKRLLSQFKNIMIIILLISAITSITLAIITHDNENLFEGLLVLAIVFVNAIVGVIQEQKAENAMLSLEKSTEPFATVTRDGITQKIKASDVVVGDILILKAGNSVPADARIIDSNNFKCDESQITGESHPADKHSKTIRKSNLLISQQDNMCFSGTSVVSGTATAVVTATGKNTEIGKIAKILNTSIKEKTPLEKNIDKIGKVITIGVLSIVFIVFIVQILLHDKVDFMQSFLTAIALAVAAIPESLPAVITIIMAMGVQKLARKNAIIKKLSAVETLGCCNVICSDKTGTLTKNIMTVSHVYANLEIFDADSFKPKNFNTLTQIFAVCNNIKFNKQNKPLGDATEISIIKFLISKNIDHESIKKIHKKICENEFNSSRKMMSALYENKNERIVFSKGAIDYVLPKCDSVLIDGKPKSLTPELRKKIMLANEKVCENGERVIAFAFKYCTTLNEDSLIFAGFMGINDPPKNESFKAITDCKKAGLKPIMITGDHQTTAFAIAKKLKITSNKNEVLTGNDIDKLSSSQLSKIIHKYSVFARVTPEHKLKIVQALKEYGNIVSMTGDGVNDAPSIKTANIGVCMGQTGTDVTKEVADIIISDDNFSTIVLAIKEGRTIYQNITKTIVFLLSTNLVEVLGIFITSLVLPNATFLLPTQILFINLVTDSLPAFALGIEPPEKDIMNKPPRDANKTILSGKTGWTILYQGFAQTLIVLLMFVISANIYSEKIASTMCFLTICLMQIIHSVNCKTETSIFKTNIFKNAFFNFSFVLLFVLILAVYFVPALSQLFALSVITPAQWLIVSATSISIIPIVELGKIIINKKR